MTKEKMRDKSQWTTKRRRTEKKNQFDGFWDCNEFCFSGTNTKDGFFHNEKKNCVSIYLIRTFELSGRKKKQKEKQTYEKKKGEK